MNMENEKEKKNANDYIDSDLSGLIDDIKNEIPDGEEKQNFFLADSLVPD